MVRRGRQVRRYAHRRRGTLRFADERPKIAVGRKQYIYYAGTQQVPGNAAPRLVNVPHSVSVHANVPKGGAEGVLFSMGGVDGGFVFYVQDGKLTYGYNYVADQRFKVQSDKAHSRGRPHLQLRVQADRQGRYRQGQGRASVDERCSSMASQSVRAICR